MGLLKESGTVPLDKHRLTNLVTEGIMQSLTRKIFIWSRLHDLLGNFDITTLM